MERTVTVTGHGSATAVPDRAVVRVAAAHRAPTVVEAVAGVDSAVAAITRVARGLVDGGAIGSTGLQVWGHTGQGGPDGFEASHQLRVACPHLPAASALVVGLAEEVGDALRVDSVQLEVSDAATAQAAAREAAYDEARGKAAHLARLAGRELGDVVTLHEGEGPVGPMRAAAAGLEPGESSVAVSVTVTWQLS